MIFLLIHLPSLVRGNKGFKQNDGLRVGGEGSEATGGGEGAQGSDGGAGGGEKSEASAERRRKRKRKAKNS